MKTDLKFITIIVIANLSFGVLVGWFLHTPSTTCEVTFSNGAGQKHVLVGVTHGEE